MVALPIQSLQTFFSHCCSIWAAILLLSKMIYQLNIVDYLNWRVNCTVRSLFILNDAFNKTKNSDIALKSYHTFNMKKRKRKKELVAQLLEHSHDLKKIFCYLMKFSSLDLWVSRNFELRFTKFL